MTDTTNSSTSTADSLAIDRIALMLGTVDRLSSAAIDDVAEEIAKVRPGVITAKPVEALARLAELRGYNPATDPKVSKAISEDHVDFSSSAARQHYIDTGYYLPVEGTPTWPDYGL